MQALMRICLVFVVLVFSLQWVDCDDLETHSVEDVDQDSKPEELPDLKKDGKGLSGGGRRTTTQATTNVTRDSQLLSVLAARRRQLLNGRLASHINTLASLTHKNNRHNTTFAQLELRESNSSVVKRITFDNTSNESSPTLKLITTDGTKEIRQDVKPHEIRHIFIPKVYHETRSRAGFINNKRKDLNNTKYANSSQEIVSDNNAQVYIPPDKLEGLEKEIEIDPEEEFQVDESNHGLYLLNYSDTDNLTVTHDFNKTLNTYETKDKTSFKIISLTPSNATFKDNVTSTDDSQQNLKNGNVTEARSKIDKTENDKEKANNTLFMSDEIYNHFRPLETELPVEDMAPFIYFGQKLGGGAILNENLTNSPSLSASTKTVNFILAPPERRKFNSRYSASDKHKNSSVEEEEINEEMDVSVVKNIIEKNKIRNSVKGPAPARHVGLVNAYRKFTTVSTSKPPNIAQLNVTDPIISVTPNTIEKPKGSNRTISHNATYSIDKTNNSSNTSGSSVSNNSTIIKNNQIKNSNATTTPRNYTRTYLNLRRRPARINGASTDTILPVVIANVTTEKASTLVYTAVVTSVSITSSMKGHNKTDIGKDADNSTLGEIGEFKDINSAQQAVTLNDQDLETSPASTNKPNKHRIRIRTTTTESTLNTNPPPSTQVYKTTDLPIASELSTKNVADLKSDPILVSRFSERLASLYGKPENSSSNSSMVKPKNILRRRRPTTTSTTTTTTTTTPFPTHSYYNTKEQNVVTTSLTSQLPTTIPTTEITEASVDTSKPLIVTSRTSSESSSKPLFLPSSTEQTTIEGETKFNTSVNNDKDNNNESLSNEEVVIEAEKTYTTSYVLAGLGFLPVAAIVAFVLRNILNKKIKEIDTEYEGYFDDGEIKKEAPIIPVARPPMPTPPKPDQKWEFPRNKLRLQTLLGQGNFGQVWKAEADDLAGHDGLTRLVAVKTIKETASQKEKQELLHEIYIMQKIGTHPNVVTLLACCTEQEPYLLVMEYVMCGKLLSYLRERRAPPDRFSGRGALTSRDLTVFAYCVARGMDYISSKGIVHRDLAARNVLVDHNKLCKIADFGMSRAGGGGGGGGGAGGGRHALPVRWMAPEALLHAAHAPAADVWSFGVLLWEIVTLGSTPYAAMSGREVLAAVTEGYRLERPPHCRPQLYRTMAACWHADPAQRPTFSALRAQLAELLDNEPSEGHYVDLDSFYQESSVYSDPSAIIHDEEGLSAEYDRERRCFRELAPAPQKFDNRSFNFREEEQRNKFAVNTPRMGGFGIRDMAFNNEFDRQFADKNFAEKSFPDRSFGERNFTERSFDANFNERKEGKLSTSSFHNRDKERENPLVSRNSFNGFPRVGARESHFQLMSDGRNKRVSEFECDI